MAKNKNTENKVVDVTKLVFKKADGTKIPDIVSYVDDWRLTHPNSELFIGCDSIDKKYMTKYSIAIVMYDKGKGGHVVTAETEDKGNMEIMQRLWPEIEQSVNTAKLLEQLNIPITIHIDYNNEKTYKSNQLLDAAIGYANSVGFKAEGKPNAPAASYAADKNCRK